MKSLFQYLFLPLAIVFMVSGCLKKQGIIMTVTGPVNTSDLGTTLPHEHILVDFIGADSTGYFRWNRDTVAARVMPYLIEAGQSGVKTLVECTPAYLGRDVVLMKRLSTESGIQIITNTGYYGGMDNKGLPRKVYSMTADQLAETWINEWLNGIENTGIKPGMIKIAVARDSVLSPVHEKLVRAAARAHLRTGLTINGHTGPDVTIQSELKVLMEEGVDPSAFIWTHAQDGTSPVHAQMAREGFWIAFDNVRTDNISLYIPFLEYMKKENLLNKVLISHDAGWYNVTDPYGMSFRGYTAIFTHLKAALSEKGFTEKDWTMITVNNPASAYEIRVRSRQ